MTINSKRSELKKSYVSGTTVCSCQDCIWLITMLWYWCGDLLKDPNFPIKWWYVLTLFVMTYNVQISAVMISLDLSKGKLYKTRPWILFNSPLSVQQPPPLFIPATYLDKCKSNLQLNFARIRFSCENSHVSARMTLVLSPSFGITRSTLNMKLKEKKSLDRE